MDQIILPEFLNTEEKYNNKIHETDTIEKFEALFLKLLSDDSLELSSIIALMKVIERDVIMVNKVYEASDLMNMTESFLNYIMMKISDKNQSKQQQQQQQEPYVLTTTSTNDIGEDVLPQKLTKIDQKSQNKKINKHKKIIKPKQNGEQVTGYFECDCMDHKPHQK